MGYVAEGSFRYCCTNSRGENKIVGYTFEHSFVGNYPAFRLGDNSNVDIQAICNCTVYIVNNRQLEEFYDRDDTNLKLGRHIAEILLWEVYERMISMYSMTPEERYREILERCPGLLNLISLKELASYLMICPETLSRLRRKLVQNKILISVKIHLFRSQYLCVSIKKNKNEKGYHNRSYIRDRQRIGRTVYSGREYGWHNGTKGK